MQSIFLEIYLNLHLNSLRKKFKNSSILLLCMTIYYYSSQYNHIPYVFYAIYFIAYIKKKMKNTQVSYDADILKMS